MPQTKIKDKTQTAEYQQFFFPESEENISICQHISYDYSLLFCSIWQTSRYEGCLHCNDIGIFLGLFFSPRAIKEKLLLVFEDVVVPQNQSSHHFFSSRSSNISNQIIHNHNSYIKKIKVVSKRHLPAGTNDTSWGNLRQSRIASRGTICL